MSFPRYPSYKPSGVEWLGEVPAHWEVKRLKCNLRLWTEKTERRANPVALENIESWTGRFVETETEFQGDGVAFQRGDILFGKLRPYLAKAFLADASGEAVGDFHVLRPTAGVFDRFAQYQILNREFIAMVDGSTFGSKMPRASWEFVGGIKVTTPPLAEQTRIAEFLDRETAKIDELVAEQRRLMELLKEKRQAVISHSVTRGLNPKAPLKPSGVEWLGDVPAHWRCAALKYLAKTRTGFAFSSEAFVSEGTPVLRIGDITTEGSVDFSDAKYLPIESEAEHTDVLVVRSDIVMAMTGATIGKSGWYSSDRPALLNQRVCIFRAIAPNEQRYLWHILAARFYAEHIALASVGGAQPNISDSQLLQCIVPLPPESEQRAIADFLDLEILRFDTLTAEAQRAIDLLQERRTALISAAVTGQIDVRGLAADTPTDELLHAAESAGTYAAKPS